MVVLFDQAAENGDFELGDFTSWTGTVGAPTVTDVRAHHGTYGMLINAAEYAYVTIAASDTVYLRSYVYFTTLPTDDYYKHNIHFIAVNGAPNFPVIAEVYHDPADHKNKFSLWNAYTDARIISTVEPVISQWYCVELKFAKNAANIMYVDEVEVANGCNSPNIQADRIGVGSAWSHLGSSYRDCVHAEDAYIGEESAAGTAQTGGAASQMIGLLNSGVLF